MLGRHVRDIVSGFKGVATSRVRYINGCVQYGVQAKAGDNGKLPDIVYVDEGRLRPYGKPIELPSPAALDTFSESDDHRDRPGGNMRDAPKI